MWEFIVGFIPRAIIQGMPLLFGSTGEILTEKSGNLNLGIPGIMWIGAISGASGAWVYSQAMANAGKPIVGLIAVLIAIGSCLIGSMLMGLLYCFLTVTLRANQNATGLAMTIFGTGAARFLTGTLTKLLHSPIAVFEVSKVADIFCDSKVPGWLAYVGIGIAILASLFLKYTRTGLQLRAVGENPATADAAGVNVTRYKYVATIVGSMIAGLGGLYYIMEITHGIISAETPIDATGWLAIAIVIFTTWRPAVSILASIGFGGLLILGTHLKMPMGFNTLFTLIPYVVTLIVLIIVSLRKKRENQPPQSLGLAYFREER